MFRGFMPLVGEAGYRYLPWLTLTTILALLVVLQLFGTSKINGYYRKTVRGETKTGQRILERIHNAEWNEQIRKYCKSNGLVIVKRGQTDSDSSSTAENAL